MRLLLDKFLASHNEAMKVIGETKKSFAIENEQIYALWCGQFYYFVCHATRLLAASARHLGTDQDELHIRFLDHMQEEKHHEKLLENDLLSLGYNVKDIAEWPVVAQMYQSQYYLIDYESPLALLGSIFYLEGMSITAGPEFLKRALEAHGPAACSFLKLHVGEDVEHIEKAKAALKLLNEAELRSVLKSHNQTAYLYESMIEQINLRAGYQIKKIA